MMSPGWTALSGTFGRLAYCAAAEGGSETPACSHAHMVRPEQSNASGPAAPKTYGAPMTDSAAAAAVAPPPDGGGIDGGVLLPPPDVGGAGAGWLTVVAGGGARRPPPPPRRPLLLRVPRLVVVLG